MNQSGSVPSRAGRRARLVLWVLLAVVGLPAVSLLTASVAAAAPPNAVQSASGTNSNGTTGSTVSATASLGSACTAGDTLVAMVAIGQNPPGVGLVPAVPAGWRRLYEHTPTTLGSDPSPYQGWFSKSCSGGEQNVTFSATSPENPTGTEMSVDVTEFSGLPNPVAEDIADNGGSASSSTSSSINGGGPPQASGELTLGALSFYGSGASQTTPTGWNLGASQTGGGFPAYTYWQLGNSSTPSISLSWTPASSYEATIVALKAGPSIPAPNVVQENQGAFTSSHSPSVSLPNGIAAGDALVAMLGTDSSAGHSFEASGLSGGGVTWQEVTGVAQSGNGSAEMWVGFGSTGTSGATSVTASLDDTVDGTMVVSEVSGISGIDTSGHTTGNSAAPQAPSINPSAGDLVVAFLATNPSSVALHFFPNWSTFSVPAATYAGEWQSNWPGGTSNPQWASSPSGEWATVQAAFDAPPFVSSVSPSAGSLGGGTAVTVTGAGFNYVAGQTTVMFGSHAATGVTVSSATSITATSPAGSGVVDVTVTTPAGTSATTSADRFTYTTGPAVSSISPSTGPAAGGTGVSITGSGFTGATGVRFGTKAASGVTVNSATSITATSPAGSGVVDVTVTTPGGTSPTSSADHFTYIGSGYWMVGSDGGVFAFGTAGFVGSLPGLGVHVNNIVGVVPTADHQGYWMVGSDGGVFAFGDAGFVGSLPGLGVHVKNIVGVVPTADGKGYWMVGSDGGVFAFGDAGFVGSLPGLGVHVNDIRAVVPTADGKGYWMVGTDGGVFAFGDAGFVGSLPGLGVHVSNIRAVIPTADGKGYWMVGTDGGVFAFGDAGFVGSLPGLGVHVNDIVGAVATNDGKGYWMVGTDGGVFAFGDAGFVGSLPGLGVHVNDIVGVVPA